MPESPRTFQHRNKLKPCSAPDCYKPRWYIARYCAVHHEARTKWGHPHAQPIQKQEIAPYVKIAARIIKQNSDHEAVRSAIVTTIACIAPGNQPWGADSGKRRYRLWRELSRLAEADPPVTPHEALAVACGVFLYIQDNPRVIPKTDLANRSVEFALARAVLSLRELRGRWMAHPTDFEKSIKHTYDIPTTAMATLGKRLMTQLVSFYVNVERTYRKELAAERRRQDMMNSPLLVAALEKEGIYSA
jgi:hypothetical protein